MTWLLVHMQAKKMNACLNTFSHTRYIHIFVSIPCRGSDGAAWYVHPNIDICGCCLLYNL